MIDAAFKEMEDNEDTMELILDDYGVLIPRNGHKPKLSLSFETEEEMIEFMAKCSLLALKSILQLPENMLWGIENVSDKEHYIEKVNRRLAVLKGR